MGLIENKFCNMLYGQRLGKNRTYSVHEEMLCAGDFLTGKAICQVSEATSVLPLPDLRASVSQGETVLSLLPLWRPLGLPVSSLCMCFLGSIPQQCPQDRPFLSPSHTTASAGGTLKQHLFLRHILNVLLKYNIHSKEYIIPKYVV